MTDDEKREDLVEYCKALAGHFGNIRVLASRDSATPAQVDAAAEELAKAIDRLATMAEMAVVAIRVGDMVRTTYDGETYGPVTRVGPDLRGALCAWFKSPWGEMHDRVEDLERIGPAASADPEPVAVEARPDAEDAARYRWLRGEVHGPHVPLAQVVWKLHGIRDSGRWTSLCDGASLDSHIDAAMASDAGAKP